MKTRAMAPILLAFLLAGCSPILKIQSGGPPAKPFNPYVTQQTPTSPWITLLHPESPLPSAPGPSDTPPPLEPPPISVIVTPESPGHWPPPRTYGSPPTPSTAIPRPMSPIGMPSDAVNILLLGSDRRQTTFRTDTILILSLIPSKRAAVLISVPRDLYLYLPGVTTQRINAAVMYGDIYGYPGGGWQLLNDTILYNLGIQIHHHALVEMQGFSDIVDTLGGVDVHVACEYTDWRLRSPRLDPEDADNWSLFTAPAGVVHMDGDYALWYARARKKSSDLDRARRQQEVLRAMYRQILRLDLIPKIPDLYDDLTKVVATDLNLLDLLRLAPLTARIKLSQVRSRFIGSRLLLGWKTPDGAQVYLPRRSALRDFLQQAYDFDTPDLLVPEAAVTIEVRNASSNPDWDVLAAERLQYLGYDSAVGPEFEPSDIPTYLIDYGISRPETRAQIVSALGLSKDVISTLPDPSSPFAYRLVIGDNYNPCFKPNLQ
jgi:LCP family protein required for cell wall assembly